MAPAIEKFKAPLESIGGTIEDMEDSLIDITSELQTLGQKSVKDFKGIGKDTGLIVQNLKKVYKFVSSIWEIIQFIHGGGLYKAKNLWSSTLYVKIF